MNKIITNKQKRKAERGFALVIISIIAVFAGIIIYGTILQTTSSKELNKVRLTKEKMQKIEYALHNFVTVNKYLPCPAPLNVLQSDSTYGLDNRADTTVLCSASSLSGVYDSSTGTPSSDLYYGAVPTRTLGLQDDDGIDKWGSKIVYVIDDKYTIATTEDNNTGFTFYISEGAGTTDDGEIFVNPNYYVYLILSHGKDKDGAYSARSITRSTATNTNTLDASDDFDVTFEHISNDILLLGNEAKLRDLTVVVEEGVGDQGDIQTECICSSYTKVIEDVSMVFPAVKCGETSYANQVCPTEVEGSPSNTDDYYYRSADEHERPYLLCEDGGEWSDSDIQNPCLLLPVCGTEPKTKQDGYSISWSKVSNYVYTRSFTGTYNDGIATRTIHAVCIINSINSVTDATMKWGYYIEM